MARSTDEIPSSVRVRTDEGNRWRYDAIENAAAFYDENRSDAIAHACLDVTAVLDAVSDVLNRDDLTAEQAREIAERFDRATRGVEIDAEREVSIDAE